MRSQPRAIQRVLRCKAERGCYSRHTGGTASASPKKIVSTSFTPKRLLCSHWTAPQAALPEPAFDLRFPWRQPRRRGANERRTSLAHLRHVRLGAPHARRSRPQRVRLRGDARLLSWSVWASTASGMPSCRAAWPTIGSRKRKLVRCRQISLRRGRSSPTWARWPPGNVVRK